MKKLYAHWCYFNNFGDALNPYLLNKLSGCKVIFCNSVNPQIKSVLKCLINRLLQFKKVDINQFIPPVLRRNRKIILAIGSTLSRSQFNFQVWGAGFMNEFEHANDGTLFAVRGPYSAEKLHNDGFPLCKVYGDPALLLPLVYHPVIKKEKSCGIIPHWKEYNYFRNRFVGKNVINLSNENIEYIIDQIVSCTHILSTSLHGIIVAHAYGVPALWIKHGDINTDGIKFKDYFASVGIPFYDGNFNISNLLSMPYNEYPQNIQNLMLPKIPIIKIQQNLIDACPFKILTNIKEKAFQNSNLLEKGFIHD